MIIIRFFVCPNFITETNETKQTNECNDTACAARKKLIVIVELSLSNSNHYIIHVYHHCVCVWMSWIFQSFFCDTHLEWEWSKWKSAIYIDCTKHTQHTKHTNNDDDDDKMKKKMFIFASYNVGVCVWMAVTCI